MPPILTSEPTTTDHAGSTLGDAQGFEIQGLLTITNGLVTAIAHP
jgi:hypothetical protein